MTLVRLNIIIGGLDCVGGVGGGYGNNANCWYHIYANKSAHHWHENNMMIYTLLLIQRVKAVTPQYHEQQQPPTRTIFITNGFLCVRLDTSIIHKCTTGFQFNVNAFFSFIHRNAVLFYFIKWKKNIYREKREDRNLLVSSTRDVFLLTIILSLSLFLLQYLYIWKKKKNRKIMFLVPYKWIK